MRCTSDKNLASILHHRPTFQPYLFISYRELALRLSVVLRERFQGSQGLVLKDRDQELHIRLCVFMTRLDRSAGIFYFLGGQWAYKDLGVIGQ